jgi:hypothetical protein
MKHEREPVKTTKRLIVLAVVTVAAGGLWLTTGADAGSKAKPNGPAGLAPGAAYAGVDGTIPPNVPLPPWAKADGTIDFSKVPEFEPRCCGPDGGPKLDGQGRLIMVPNPMHPNNRDNRLPPGAPGQ